MQFLYLKVLDAAPRRTVILVNTTNLRDSAVVGKFNDELEAAVNNYMPLLLVVDLNHIAATSTQVINGLLSAKRRLLAEGCDLVLKNVSEPMRHNLCILNLAGTVFQILDDDASDE